jgi:two-component system alkaline phosphatase synthesis response regulator PhoP
MLPEVGGFELMPYMRKYHIPVIYLSAKSDVTDRVRGLRLGAEDYLVKPFHILELLVRIETFHSNDEIGELSNAFDRMADSIQNQIHSLNDQIQKRQLLLNVL